MSGPLGLLVSECPVGSYAYKSAWSFQIEVSPRSCPAQALGLQASFLLCWGLLGHVPTWAGPGKVCQPPGCPPG